MIELSLMNKNGIYKTIVFNPGLYMIAFEVEVLAVTISYKDQNKQVYLKMKSKEDGFNLLRKIGLTAQWNVLYLYDDGNGLTMDSDCGEGTEYYEEIKKD